jgi:hypothetical protein
MAQNKQENQILKHLMDLDQGPRYDMLIIKEVVIKMIKIQKPKKISFLCLKIPISKPFIFKPFNYQIKWTLKKLAHFFKKD